MIDEATEIAGKKIASEEETFSDLSILIFRNNLLVPAHVSLLLLAISVQLMLINIV